MKSSAKTVAAQLRVGSLFVLLHTPPATVGMGPELFSNFMTNSQCALRAAWKLHQTGFRAKGSVMPLTRPNSLRSKEAETSPGSAGNPWTRSYDEQGRLISTTDPLGRVAAYEYDSRDRVAGITFPEGEVTFAYDEAGEVTRAAYSDGLELQYSYDRVGRLVAANGLALGYDALGEIIESNGVIIARDDAHRVAAVTFGLDKTVNYEYDCRGLLSTITDWRGGVTKFAYDDARQLVAVERPNGRTA